MSDKDRYYFLKEHGLCVKCGQAYAMPGRVHCESCHEKATKWCKRWRAKHPDFAKEQWQARKDSGLCARCGVMLYRGERNTCAKCKDAQREAKRREMQRKAVKEGK